MRKSLWIALVVVSLILAACGPAMSPSTSPKTARGDTFLLALPRLEIEFDKDGNPTVLGMKLAEVGAMLGQDLSGIRLDPFLVNWMMTTDIQHIEMRQTGDGMAVVVNGKPLPHITWNDQSLERALQLAEVFAPGNENQFNAIRKLLPIVSRLGLDVVVRFPLQPGAKAIPLAEPAVVMAKANPVKDPASLILWFDIRYDAQGVPSVLGITGYDLADLGLPLPVAIDRPMLQSLQNKNVQALELRTKPDGLFIYLNNEPLPNLTWDRQLLKNAAELYARMNPQSPIIPTVNQLIPGMDTLDIGVLVYFPPAPGVPVIEAKMH
ncbi:MAG: hypothetical protein ACP5UQ_05890 [Anaerolineae bacterium]